MTEADVTVVGAGIAGLVATLELLERGRDMLLLDRCRPDEVGGLAREAFGGGLHGKRSLEGTFLGACVLTARVAAETVASN